MKKIALLVSSLLLTTLSFHVFAQMDENAQKAWTAYMTPGDVHKMIAKYDGQWKEEVSWWLAPGQEPSKSTATCTNTMILGGRYQQSMIKGDMMGMPFEGTGLLGYDNAQKLFYSTWVDNMGTGVMTMKGTWDDATKSINLTGSTVDPVSGKEMPVRETISIIDDNTQLLQMYTNGSDGKEFKTMEIKSTRM